LKAIPAEHPTTDHGHASSHLLARSLVTYSNERYEDRILPFGTPDDALDCAAGLLLGNPPDRRPPKDERGAALAPTLRAPQLPDSSPLDRTGQHRLSASLRRRA